MPIVILSNISRHCCKDSRISSDPLQRHWKPGHYGAAKQRRYFEKTSDLAGGK
jgi:hypothetical protein